MTLIATLRELLGTPEAASFQLMGEDLTLVSAARLAELSAGYRDELSRTVPAQLHASFEAEQQAFLREAHRWLKRYNRSLHARIAGYLALGERCRYFYPWPVVAVLGLCQVLRGLGRNRLYGLLAPGLTRVGLGIFEELIDGTDDVLRRTNRAIFADSVPTVLLALRARELSDAGDQALAHALLEGPLPPLMDDESRALARALYNGLAISHPTRRFETLAALTLRHFGREQAIFTYQIASRPSGRAGQAQLARLTRLRSVPAPTIARTRGKRSLTFTDFTLPIGFDIRDHDVRLEAFGRAFVSSITASVEDYATAREYVRVRFARSS